MRTKLLWVMALVILGVVNYAVWQKGQVLAEGKIVLLELAPRDPRSLMQGDYMVLRYHVAEDIRRQLGEPSADGLAVVALDEQGKAGFVRIHQANTPLQENEVVIRYRKRGQVVRIGAESYFFQEGRAAVYAPAKYGEVKVAKDGEVVLVGLRDAERRPLGPAVSANGR